MRRRRALGGRQVSSEVSPVICPARGACGISARLSISDTVALRSSKWTKYSGVPLLNTCLAKSPFFLLSSERHSSTSLSSRTLFEYGLSMSSSYLFSIPFGFVLDTFRSNRVLARFKSKCCDAGGLRKLASERRRFALCVTVPHDQESRIARHLRKKPAVRQELVFSSAGRQIGKYVNRIREEEACPLHQVEGIVAFGEDRNGCGPSRCDDSQSGIDRGKAFRQFQHCFGLGRWLNLYAMLVPHEAIDLALL